MSNTTEQFDYMKLSIDDRIRLAQDIWDSIIAEGLPLPIPDDHKEVLDQRLEEHSRSPDEVIPWEEVKRESNGLQKCWR